MGRLFAADAAAASSAAAALNGAVDWWKDVNESPMWQDRIFHALAVLYGIVSVVALIQLIRIECRVPEYGWTTQKVFHFLNFVVNGGGAVHCFRAAAKRAADTARGVSLFAAFGFLLYGGRLFLMLQRFPVESKGRRKTLQEVGYVTTICFTCFLIRCVMMCLNAFDKAADLDILSHPILNFFYYLV
ncbi:hypothetical protein ACQ4PT_071096 [Festuca glaucescens]